MRFRILLLGVARYMHNAATPYQLKILEWISIENFDSIESIFMHISK